MGIDVAPATVAWILFILGASGLSYLIGGFVYWNKGEEQIKELKLREELHSCACRSKRKPSAGR